MLEIISSIPIGWVITLIILGMLLVTFISIKGNVVIKWGKKRLGIGKQNLSKGRTCMDCSKLHRSKAAKVHFKIIRIESNILKSKMNHVEQELLTLKRNLYTTFSKIIKLLYTTKLENKMKDFNTRICLILEDVVKDEIRRSIKENGFHEKTGDEFYKYVEGQKKMIQDIIEDNLLVYYDNDIILKISDQINKTLNIIMKSIYEEVKNIEVKAIKDIEVCEQKYETDLDNFIGLNIVEK